MSNIIRNSTVNPIVAQKMVAAVDIGTNSFHMIVVKVHPNGRFCKVDSHKEYVRLGSGNLSSSGIIGAEEEQRALEAMKRFRTLAESHKSDMRIVATSAVREAKNRAKFVRRVSEVAGADVEVLSGKEEARLIYRGILQNNAHLHGYSTVEIEIIALLARYHRKKFPSHKHDSFAKLPQEAQKKVKALSAIIRIAVALERSNFSAIQQVDVMYDNGAYTTVVTPSLMDPLTGVERDVSLEVWAAQSEFKHFEEVFGRKMLIAVAGNLKP